ncbi:Intracellular serine protease [Aquisphaera giovannonii]|uniref:Intracellular serine protease n=1 Tax=Aquisphaera giovannonii TaxID=406548 RepID=A0A5B9WAJ2_9BACT|nr:S8 family serine peptidase [Aquisphaera giovannonii]QEH37269.1 Intracellular serine protease [Aquisphaera giovannonii]
MGAGYLSRRIEEIVEEHRRDVGAAARRPLSVIVQMATGDDMEGYLRASVEAIELRRSVATARSLVPPRFDLLVRSARGGPLGKSARRELEQSASPSAESFLAGVRSGAVEGHDVAEAGKSALQPLMDSDWVLDRVAQAERSRGRGSAKADRQRPPGSRPVPVHFLSSGSAVLEVTRDELAALPRQVPQALDIYVNRTVKVPPVAKSPDLPPVVRDNKSATWGLARTGALAAWGAFAARGQGVKVAVLDTGVDPSHPDLSGRVAGFAEFDPKGRLVAEGLARAHDSGEHGTHCGATIAGGRASGRCIGMAPDAQVLAGLVLKDGVGTDAQILAGMEWAIRSGAQVISMSLGGLRLSADVLDTYTRTIITANRLGIPVVVAVGNEGSQTTGSPGNDFFAFTVGATDVDDRAAGFSGGRTQIISNSRYVEAESLPLVYSKPEVTAPGVDIYSAVPGGGWEAWSGTSMATPHVAGAMAILLGALPGLHEVSGALRTNLVQTLLISTVKELGEAGQNHRHGFGRIDVLRALGYAVELGYGPPEFSPPRPVTAGKRGRRPRTVNSGG